MAFRQTLFTAMALLAAVALPVQSQLTYYYYDRVCPQALPTIRTVVRRAISRDARMGASLLRMHFHDCFVNGCDASILLDGAGSEQEAPPNMGSVRGFEVIDEIKQAVDSECRGSVVSCADILAVAARDSVVLLGGRHYQVPLGRRDSRQPFFEATRALPGPSDPFSKLLSSFQDQGLSLKDLVVLSGAHTVGFAQCRFARGGAQSPGVDQGFASMILRQCPADSTLVPLDGSARRFDNRYYKNLEKKRGVLASDLEIFKGDGGESDRLVRYYSENLGAFWNDFGESMVRMGNIKPLTGNQGEVRRSCGSVNNQGGGGGGYSGGGSGGGGGGGSGGGYY